MPFGTYKTLGAALQALQITETQRAFIEPKQVAVSDFFRSELELTLRDFDVSCSEAAICESLLFPLLREALKPYAAVLGLWSHVAALPRRGIARRARLHPRQAFVAVIARHGNAPCPDYGSQEKRF